MMFEFEWLTSKYFIYNHFQKCFLFQVLSSKMPQLYFEESFWNRQTFWYLRVNFEIEDSLIPSRWINNCKMFEPKMINFLNLWDYKFEKKRLLIENSFFIFDFEMSR